MTAFYSRVLESSDASTFGSYGAILGGDGSPSLN